MTAKNSIVVTGGAGFIGSHIVDRLLKDGHRVICVDDFNDYYPLRFKRENIVRHKNNPDFTLIEADITDKNALKRLFIKEKIDLIIHLAARAGVRASLAYPLLYQRVNVLGTTNLLELSHRYKVKQFIFISSSSVYGKSPTPFSENSPIKTPLSPYAASKSAAELMCYVYHYLYKQKITILRLFSVYGPRGRPDMAPYLFTKAILEGKPIQQFGDGSSSRDWTYIDDIVDGVIKALNMPFNFEIINLGSNQPISLKKLIKKIEQATGKKARIKRKRIPAGEIKKTWAKIDKANHLLGWQPKISFSKGIKNFVEWFKRNRLS